MATAIPRRRATKPPSPATCCTVWIVCHESGERYFAGDYESRDRAEALAAWVGDNGVLFAVVDGAPGDAPRQTYSVASDMLMQVVTIDADGHEDIACPCVPEVFGKSFIEMYNRHPSGRRAVGRRVVAVVVGGAA